MVVVNDVRTVRRFVARFRGEFVQASPSTRFKAGNGGWRQIPAASPYPPWLRPTAASLRRMLAEHGNVYQTLVSVSAHAWVATMVSSMSWS